MAIRWRKKIISEHRAELELLAKSLIEYETLTGDEIKDLLVGKKAERAKSASEAHARAAPPCHRRASRVRRPEAGDVAPATANLTIRPWLFLFKKSSRC